MKIRRDIKASEAWSLDDMTRNEIKVALFDYLCDFMLDIDGVPALDVVNRIADLYPNSDVEDVIKTSYEEGIPLIEALEMIEAELK